MSELAQSAARLLDMLPAQEQTFAYEMIRRIVLAWDSDFSKLTDAEAEALRLAEEEAANGDTLPHDAIDWDN